MLYHDRINVFEGMEVNKSNTPKECVNCHYWYFLNNNLGFNELFVRAVIIY